MKLFSRENPHSDAHARAVWARFELIYTLVDFGAAFAFIIGSILFFYASLQLAGTWLFLIGSILFAAKPTIRLTREIKLYRMGDYGDLARRIRD